MIPTRTQVNSFNFDPMESAAQESSTLADGVLRDASNIRSAITGLDWSGKAADSAVDRANREFVQRTRVTKVLDTLSTAITDGQGSMSSIADNLKKNAAAYEDDLYEVSDDWTVTDGFNYPLAEAVSAGNQAALDRIATQKAQRANDAAEATTRLKRLAIEFQTADQTCAAAIRDAISDLGTLAPTVAGLSEASAQQIVDALKAGRPLTRMQLEQLRAGTNLTDKQISDLRLGRTVTIPQGQHSFLRTLMSGLDGMAVDDIVKLGVDGQHAPVQQALGNAVQLASAPKIQTQAGDRGGMALLPSSVQTLLRTNLIDSKGGDGLPKISRYREFTALGDLLKNSNPQYRVGTDFDRGMLKQISELSGALGDADREAVRANFGQVDKFLSQSMSSLSSDIPALHDFITGDNMDVTCDNDGRYNANDHMTQLLSYKWGSGMDPYAAPGENLRTGIDDLFRTLNSGATSENPYIAGLSRNSADVFGHYLTSDDGFEANRDLGTRSPHLLRTLSETLSPYLGGFSDAPSGPRGVETYGVNYMTGNELDRLFQVMDGDADSARIFNKSAMNWQNYMAYQSGLHGDSSLGRAAGILNQSMLDGYTNTLPELRQDELASQVDQYNSMMNTYNLATTIGGDALGSWNPAAGTAASVLAPSGAELLFGQAPTLDTATNSNIEKLEELEIDDMTNNEMVTLSFYAGVLDSDTEIREPNPAWLTDGKLDVEKIFASNDQRNKWRDFSAGVADDKWDDNWNHGVVASGGAPLPLNPTKKPN